MKLLRIPDFKTCLAPVLYKFSRESPIFQTEFYRIKWEEKEIEIVRERERKRGGKNEKEREIEFPPKNGVILKLPSEVAQCL